MKLGLLLGAALAPLTFAVPAFAQTVPQSATEIDEVVVVGRRPIAESEAAALRTQRNSDALVSVAASDSVGRLPDQNIAQAAGRLPGVAVQRDQGQARYLSLRGAPINWTTLSINGISVVSPEGRDTRYDSLPSAIASQIVVQKAVTADMTGETVAGNVDIRTRSAFDYPGFRGAGKIGGGESDLGSRNEFEAQLVLSDRFASDSAGEFGLLVSGSYYDRDMITDNFETDWEPVAQDMQPGTADRIWARETENKLYRLTRRNYSGSGRIDWAPNDDNRLFLETIFTTFTDDEARDNYIFDLDDRQADLTRPATPVCTVANNPAPTNTGYADVCIGNTPLSGTVYGIDINQRATLRAFEQSIFTTTLGGDHGFSDGWSFDWRLNFTRAIDDRSVIGEARYDSPSTRTLRPTVVYDFTNPQLARVQLFRTTSAAGTFSAGAPVTAIDDFSRTLTSLRSLDAVDTTEAYTAKFNVRRELPMFGGEARFTLGGQFDQRTKEAVENERTLSNAQSAAAGISTTFLPVSSNGPFAGEIPLGYTFRYFDILSMRNNVRLAAQVAPFSFLRPNYYNVEEQVTAAYAMGRVAYDWGSVNGGVRVEQVRNTGEAYVLLGGISTLIEVENDETLVFPSLHINYNLTEDMKLRLSFNSGAARPDYDQLRPNFTFSDTNLTVSGGNPEARPERAYGVDTYFEWYVQPQGFLSLGAFYKKVEDVLFDSVRPFGLDVLDSGGIDRSAYTLSTITNGGDGYIYGLEATVQQQLEPFTEQFGLPGWVGGFGLSANVTLNESEATAPDGSKIALPGTSDIVSNIGAYYEKYGLSMRLNYQYRSEWIDAFGLASDGGNFYWATDDELDFSARYAINDNIELYFDGSNLLNEAGRRYVRDSAYTIEWERFGSRYGGGIRFTF